MAEIKTSIRAATPDLTVAYAVQWEARWWIFHYAPAGAIVRLHTSYANRAAAEHAIRILGYTAIKPPKGSSDKPDNIDNERTP